MLAATEAIGGYVSRGSEAFDTDPALRDAIVYQIVILGEADWALDHEIVWTTAVQDVPAINTILLEALQAAQE
jgi:uncharacterized protein with HEPN domain